MVGTKATESPAIMVYLDPDYKDRIALNELLWGIEEEGVPYIVREMAHADAKALGHAAAEASRLGVGIGVSRDGEITLHFHRLPPERPLFLVRGGNKQSAQWRKIGTNAARLVKGIPFKSLEPGDDEEEAPVRGEELENLVRMVTEEVMRILAENTQGGPGKRG